MTVIVENPFRLVFNTKVQARMPALAHEAVMVRVEYTYDKSGHNDVLTLPLATVLVVRHWATIRRLLDYYIRCWC